MNIADFFNPNSISIEKLFAERLHERIRVLEEENRSLREENERMKRSPAPFSKGKKKGGKSGRKPGQGPFARRPAPENVTETVEVAVEESACPECGGDLAAAGSEDVTVTELPEIPKPVVTQYRVEICRCVACGKTVRGRHPDVAPDQTGATAHRVGERVYAIAFTLHYHLGVPLRKVRHILKTVLGVTVTQGALSQAGKRWLRAVVGDAYRALRAAVKESPWTHSDDTGWRAAGEPRHLMTFETPDATVYQIRDRHRNEEVRELIPSDYQGTLITDRGRSYDAKHLAAVKQQKCLAHIQRSLANIIERKHGRARSFALDLKALLSEALDLWKRHRVAALPDFHQIAEEIIHRVTDHLAPRVLPDRDNQRLLDELGRHHAAGNLLRFLSDPSIEPTNNRAERALRPAVIARKVSHCSKNDTGARVFEAFKSVTQTLARRGHDVEEGLVHLYQTGSVLAAPT